MQLSIERVLVLVLHAWVLGSIHNIHKKKERKMKSKFLAINKGGKEGSKHQKLSLEPQMKSN